MKSLIFILCFILSSLTHNKTVAAKSRHSYETLRYQMSTGPAVFLHFPSLHITVSENCGHSVEAMTCDAVRSLKNVSLKSVPPGKLESRNPGSYVCLEQLGQQILFGEDDARNQDTFCRFKDGSIVGTGTLTYYVYKNKKPQPLNAP